MIKLEHINLNYGDISVLHDINLHLEPGSFHYITGSSGAGKTSLLKIILLAERASSGSLSLFGYDIATLSRAALPDIRRHIGVIFQDFRLINHLTAYENAALPLRVFGQREAAYRENVIELLHWVGLGKKLAARPETLSGGEKQLVAIARAVITKPHLIIADEPTGNVDPAMAVRLIKLLEALNQMGTTIVVATHDQYLWENFPHPRLHLEQGQIKEVVSV